MFLNGLPFNWLLRYETVCCCAARRCGGAAGGAIQQGKRWLRAAQVGRTWMLLIAEKRLLLLMLMLTLMVLVLVIMMEMLLRLAAVKMVIL